VDSEFSGVNDVLMISEARVQILKQAAYFGLIGTAYHCVMGHEPSFTLEDNTLTVYTNPRDNDNCHAYATFAYKLSEDELHSHEMMHITPATLLTWLITALIDDDTNKRIEFPAVIEGPRIRVEIG